MLKNTDRIMLDDSNLQDFISAEELSGMQADIRNYHHMLHEGTGLGNECLGWLDMPSTYDKAEFERIQIAANRIKEQSDVFLVIGIGGSYLGAKAAFEMLNHTFYNELPKAKRKGPKIYFAGHNISESYLRELFEIIDGQEVSLNVISKSGTTTEPAIIFRILKQYMEDKYGRDEACQRIYVTTDKEKGALRSLANQERYETFVIPYNVGGRYSVLSSVGLLPMAVSGIPIDEVMKGAQTACDDLSTYDLQENDAYRYAAIRKLLYDKGKVTEIMANYEPHLRFFGEWYKQLFGESEGKNGKGIFPTTLNFTTDLHSVGQYIQDGHKSIFETIIHVNKCCDDIAVNPCKQDIDGLNYLSGKSLSHITQKSMEGAVLAHVHGGVPNLIINLPERSPYYFGYMVYFFMKACAMSGYLMQVNPFDQPGVEEYKTNMFKLLEKPGYV